MLDRARAALRAHFGYPDFRAGQERAIAAVLGGRDALVVLPTGGGKSLCYQVPALVLPGLTVVVSPLISLMQDQVDALAARGVPAAFLNSTLGSAELAERVARARRGELRLLYVAPERFDAGDLAARLRAGGVALLAIDEAHCISEWGHDFRPSYRRMRTVRRQLGDPPTIALTATATPAVRRDIARELGLRAFVTVVTGFDRENLHYHVRLTPKQEQKDLELLAALDANPGQAVVYAPTRRAVERLTTLLHRARIPADGYHAGLADARRQDVQQRFMAEAVRVIVATNAFGMGIDKPNVRLVVHHAMPGTLEAYYQEAGRAGRDGRLSQCVLLHSHADRYTHEFFIRSAAPERAVIEAVYETLRRLAGRDGIVRATPPQIAALVRRGASARAVESALRQLARGGAVHPMSLSQSRVDVRLLASPARIIGELAGDEMERAFLRALWRAAGPAIQLGAQVELAGLPPGFGGAGGGVALLEALAERQFLTWERTGGGWRVPRPSRPLDAGAIDWRALDIRRAGEFARLEAMQTYARTYGCRRAYVLRYFGDPAVRASCQGCDNCLSPRRARTFRFPRLRFA